MAPRLPASGRKSKGNVVPIRDGPAPPGDNSLHGEEAERVQLISIVSQLSAAEDAIEVARGPLKAAQKKRSQIIGLGKAAGFTAKELSLRLEEMKRGTRENAAAVARESKQRRWLGIVEPDQAELILGDSAPQEAKDEAHWRGEGLKAGLRQLPAKPVAECPERFVQAWLEEHAKGLKQVLEANAPKPLRNRAQEVAEQAAKDFAEDQAAERATLADDRFAEKKEERAMREALEKMDPANEEVV